MSTAQNVRHLALFMQGVPDRDGLDLRLEVEATEALNYGHRVFERVLLTVSAHLFKAPPNQSCLFTGYLWWLAMLRKLEN